MLVKKSVFTFLAVSVVLALFFTSCKNEKDSFSLDYGYDYFPTDSGHYVIYDVDSISYTFNGIHINDTAHYQQMEVITDTTYDNENNLSYVLTVYRRASAADPWVINRVWEVTPYPTKIVKREDDLRLVKLVFPPTDGAEWNGNVYLPTTTPYDDFKNWDYHYEGVHVPYSINGFSFDSTLTVSEVDDENLIKKKLRKEVYAKGVGLIYQEWEILSKNDVLGDWETGAQNGFRIRMRLAGHN